MMMALPVILQMTYINKSANILVLSWFESTMEILNSINRR